MLRKSMITALVAALAVLASLFVSSATASATPKAGANQPPTAQAGPFWIENAHGGCLTGNAFADVFVSNCVDSNLQRWEIWFGGWARNVATGWCLTLRPGWTLGLDNCRWGDVYQEWRHWNGGWFQNHFDNACLEASGGSVVRGQPCLNFTRQFWYHRV